MAKNSAAINYHEKLATKWDDRYKKGGFKRRAALFKNQLLPLVPSGGEWLDAGCGSGFFSRHLATKQSKVTGLDGSQSMITQARSLAATAGLGNNTNFEIVDTIEKIDFDSGSFDGCICLSVLEYLPNAFRCLDEITRILKPNGYFILSVPNSLSIVRFVQKAFAKNKRGPEHSSLEYLATSLFVQTPKDLHAELEKRGFEIIYFTGFDTYIPNKLHFLFPPSLIYVVARKI